MGLGFFMLLVAVGLGLIINYLRLINEAIRFYIWKDNFGTFLREEKARLERVNPRNNPNSEVSEEIYERDLNNYENERRYFEQRVNEFGS